MLENDSENLCIEQNKDKLFEDVPPRYRAYFLDQVLGIQCLL